MTYTEGIGGYSKVLDIKDLATGMSAMYPIKTEQASDIAAVISAFIGNITVKLAYSDGHDSLKAACDIIGTARINNHQTTTPGVPASNPIIEREVYLLCDKVRATLITAGLPVCFWSTICLSVSFLAATKLKHYRVVADPESGEETRQWYSAYSVIHGEEPNVDVFIIGQAVVFKPAPTIHEYDSKVEPRLTVGVFMGYEIGPSLRWTGMYKVVTLSDFCFLPLAETTERKHFEKLSMHRTEVVKNAYCEDVHYFPLKERFDRSRLSIEGAERALRLQQYDESLSLIHI